ncbi:uncharacterized protein EDB91DRAFT_333709 [Suillus paluster]|uniref:uncharacterized protein n=1 Tax=Suillus paluster TaxID=48578 RepID=UPI001B87B455|nr:uncharacterized protein EDB91DRAFT_333709 [Suillus paluster]KAG1741540.1 hypothetical protein EDB91DRAFT_333709 [Suillus paluster]
MLSTVLVLCWLYAIAAQWAGVIAESAQHAERQVSPLTHPDPRQIVGSILSLQSTSSHTSSTLSNSSSSTSSHVMTSMASAVTPSSTSSLFSINVVNNMTTCTPGIITWTYTGPSADLLLSITNINVFDPYTQHLSRRQNSAGQNVSVTLANISATLHSWTWPKVNQSQGWYNLQCSVAGFNVPSTSFFISNGSDTSCLPSSSLTAVENYTKSPSIGEIVGIVVGGVAGLIILGSLVLYYLHRRRRSRGGKRQPKQKVGRRWGSLKSNDSEAARSLAGSNACDLASHSHGHSESTGEILVVADSGKSSETTTTPGSDEYHGEEKVVPPHSPREVIPLDPLDTPLSHYNRRTSVYSYQDPSFRSDVSRARVTSVRNSEQNLESQAARIRSSMETSMYLRAERLSMPVIVTPTTPRTPTFATRGRDEYPPSPEAATSSGREPSAGASSNTHRTSRKPVPHYDPSELRDDYRSAVDTQSTFTAGGSSHSHSTEPLPPPHGIPGLSHDASFGSPRRMHYLIPDMPPPSNEQE